MEDDDFNDNYNNYQTKQQSQESQEYKKIDFSNVTQDSLSPFNLNNIEQTGIYIIISDSFQEGTGINKHTVYNIKGTDKNGDFEVTRRYNEFDVLHSTLQVYYPGIAIPSIPEKKLQNKSETFIEDRKKFLQIFLNKIAVLEFMYYGQVFQEFIRSKETNINKKMEQIQKDITPSQILDNFVEGYPELNNQQFDGANIYKISSFSNQLKKQKLFLTSVQDKIYAIANQKHIFNLDNNSLLEKILQQFEEVIISTYDETQQGNLFFNQETKFQDLKKNQKDITDQIYINSFEYFLDLIRFEISDINSLCEAIQDKDNIEKKIQQFSAQSKTYDSQLSQLVLKKSKNDKDLQKIDGQIEQLEEKQKQQIEDIEKLKSIKEYMCLIIFNKEMNKYRSEKKLIYHRLFKVVSEIEISALRSKQQFYRELQSQTELLLQ